MIQTHVLSAVLIVAGAALQLALWFAALWWEHRS